MTSCLQLKVGLEACLQKHFFKIVVSIVYKCENITLAHYVVLYFAIFNIVIHCLHVRACLIFLCSSILCLKALNDFFSHCGCESVRSILKT